MTGLPYGMHGARGEAAAAQEADSILCHAAAACSLAGAMKRLPVCPGMVFVCNMV